MTSLDLHPEMQLSKILPMQKPAAVVSVTFLHPNHATVLASLNLLTHCRVLIFVITPILFRIRCPACFRS